MIRKFYAIVDPESVADTPLCLDMHRQSSASTVRGTRVLVCWDLLVSFYFYNGRHKVRYNGRILCARVAPAIAVR
jgi:hypothetical protein